MQDVRYAFRIARRNPGSTMAALLALALGIGATTAIFSVVNAVILQPLPVHDEHSLVRIFESDSRSDKDALSMADFLDWKRQLTSFSGLALFRSDQANLTGHGPPQRVRIAKCDAELLPLMGVTLFSGRDFSPQEDQPGHDQAAILSWNFWRSHFAGQDAIGQKLILDEKPYTIAGILPRDFLVLGDFDVWLPVTIDPNNVINARGYHWYWAVGRLRPGVSLRQANAELRTAAASLAVQYPQKNKGVSAKAISLRDSIAGAVRPALLMLLGAGLCVLLIACGNVANLALASAAAREREISLRIALGAKRSRLFRQLLVENILLSVLAALAGIALALAAIRFLRNLPAGRIPNPQDITLDWRVLLFAIGSGVLTGAVFGLAPALRASMTRVHDAIKQSGARATDSRGQRRLRSVFVFLEAALATLLLIQCGLLIESYSKASHIHPGFDSRNLLTLNVSLPPTRYGPAHPGSVTSFARKLLPRIRSIPGVESAALTSALPLTATGGGSGILIEHQPRPKSIKDSPFVQSTRVSPDYFRTMKIPLVRGRYFDERDNATSPDVTIVNETFARQFFHGQDPIGKRLSPALDSPEWTEIVGIVPDVPQLGIEKPALPEIFYPLEQAELPWLSIVARTNGDPLSYTNAIRAEAEQVDPQVAIFLPRTMDQIVGRQLGWRAVQTWIVGFFATIAIILASIGIYAVVAYSAARRVNEIGIRIALGAEKSDILRMVVREGALPVLAGSVVGALCSVAVSAALAQLFYGIEATDPSTYVLVIVLFLAIAMLASYLPARRAAALDPSRALRYE